MEEPLYKKIAKEWVKNNGKQDKLRIVDATVGSLRTLRILYIPKWNPSGTYWSILWEDTWLPESNNKLEELFQIIREFYMYKVDSK